MPTPRIYVKRLRALVRQHGLREMGRRLDIHPTTIGNWLSGKRKLGGLSLAGLIGRMRKL